MYTTLLTLQWEKLRHKKGKCSAQGPSACTWWAQVGQRFICHSSTWLLCFGHSVSPLFPTPLLFSQEVKSFVSTIIRSDSKMSMSICLFLTPSPNITWCSASQRINPTPPMSKELAPSSSPQPSPASAFQIPSRSFPSPGNSHLTPFCLADIAQSLSGFSLTPPPPPICNAVFCFPLSR